MISRTFIAFLGVGLLNTLFSYTVFALLIFWQMHYSLAVLISTVLGVLFNFKTIGKLVFKSDDNRLIFRFVGVYGIIYLFNVGGLRLYRVFDDNMYLAGLLMIAPSAILSFMLLSRFVFKRQSFQASGTLPPEELPAAAERSHHD